MPAKIVVRGYPCSPGRSLLCMHATDTLHNNLHNNPSTLLRREAAKRKCHKMMRFVLPCDRLPWEPEHAAAPRGSKKEVSQNDALCTTVRPTSLGSGPRSGLPAKLSSRK